MYSWVGFFEDGSSAYWRRESRREKLPVNFHRVKFYTIFNFIWFWLL